MPVVRLLGAVFLAIDIAVGVPVAVGILTGLAAVYVFLWYGLPFLHSRH